MEYEMEYEMKSKAEPETEQIVQPEPECILSLGEGKDAVRYMIGEVIPMDGNCYFTLLNLTTFDFMFGEFLGEITDDMERNRRLIYQDFLNGCSHITYPDGYIADDLYEMLDPIDGGF